MLGVLLLCLVGIAVAQQPLPCTTPPQWEARLFDYNTEEKFAVRGRLTYDSVYQRERFIEEVDAGGMENYYDVIALFQAKLEFVVDLKARNCTRRPLQRAWRDFGIRPDARSFGESYIGSSAVPGAGILATIWGGNFTTPANETINYISAWTLQACLPISRTTFSEKSGTGHLAFFDVTPGISDPNVFIPPRECLSAKEYAMRHTLFGKPSLTRK